MHRHDYGPNQQKAQLSYSELCSFSYSGQCSVDDPKLKQDRVKLQAKNESKILCTMICAGLVSDLPMKCRFSMQSTERYTAKISFKKET